MLQRTILRVLAAAFVVCLPQVSFAQVIPYALERIDDNSFINESLDTDAWALDDAGPAVTDADSDVDYGHVTTDTSTHAVAVQGAAWAEITTHVTQYAIFPQNTVVTVAELGTSSITLGAVEAPFGGSATFARINALDYGLAVTRHKVLEEGMANLNAEVEYLADPTFLQPDSYLWAVCDDAEVLAIWNGLWWDVQTSDDPAYMVFGPLSEQDIRTKHVDPDYVIELGNQQCLDQYGAVGHLGPKGAGGGKSYNQPAMIFTDAWIEED